MSPPTLPLYDATIGLSTQSLQALQGLLKKAQAHPEADSIAATRLAPDMLPFAFQVLTVSSFAKKTVERLAPAKAAGLGAWEDNHNSSLAELAARVDKTLALLATVNFGPDHVGVAAPGDRYVLGYAIPNMFFHLSMAYAILRTKGVELGKADYIGPFVKDFFPGF
ncbi:hypothetical protein BT67DRAFT_450864 [Trichocladium antarcticum]|uniref:Uncharacterized protein n=1 Tax=Trichocladium antarcticum TaxID=1450529 RepID=A0AAN6UGR2_9PEZI|nr:hypothetical protein BT67DRAFT_450864 [Trichocladium antarcticum]